MKLKDEFLVCKKCLECDLVIDSGNDKSDYAKFWRHIKVSHGMSNHEYYLKHYLNNVRPLCGCGCGIETAYHKGGFNKYYDDHKNNVKVSEETRVKLSLKQKGNIIDILNRSGVSVSSLEKGYDDFINLRKPMSKISEELFIDFRTIKSYWVKLGFIKDKEVFKRFTLKSKSKWMSKPIPPNDSIIEFLNENIFMIKTFLVDKDKVTFNEIINFLKVKINKNYLSWFLKEHLNSSELKKVKFIKHSQLEINFLNVLSFYFGNSIEGSYELCGKIFDYKLGKNILIELDGEYWHSSDEAKLNDKIKNKIAKTEGFTLIRVNDVEVKNLKFLNRLKKIYDEIK